jgi:hypothetical protein
MCRRRTQATLSTSCYFSLLNANVCAHNSRKAGHIRLVCFLLQFIHAVTLLICIQEVPLSNLDRDTHVFSKDFVMFLSSTSQVLG